MISSGVNCFRINLSHGTQEEKKIYFDLIKSVSDASKQSRPSILADLAGPKVRVRSLDKTIKLSLGESIVLSSGPRSDGVIPISKGLVFQDFESNAKKLHYLYGGLLDLHCN